MSRRSSWWIMVCAAISLSCPAQLFQTPTAVRLTVSTDKRTYKIGEKIVASYRLQNVGNRKLFVPVRFSADCPPTVHLITELRDESGNVMRGGYIGDCSPRSFPSRLEQVKAGSKLLSPGDQYAPGETFDTQGLEPGLYRVAAKFTGWKPTEFADTDREELRQFGVPVLTGTLRSSVTIRLTR